MTQILSVQKLDIALEKSLPPNLVVTAEGTVSSGGWSNLRLEIVVHVSPPADGFQEFSFIGQRPSGIVTQALVPGQIAHARIDEVDIPNYWGAGIPLKGIRVKAASNSVDEAVS